MEERKHIVYDTGALIAAERGSVWMDRFHRQASDEGIVPVIPSVVIAQAWRGGGGRQVPMARLISTCAIVPVHPPEGRAAGNACALAETSDAVDAIVAVIAKALDAVIVTSDPDDLKRLNEAIGAKRDIEKVLN